MSTTSEYGNFPADPARDVEPEGAWLRLTTSLREERGAVIIRAYGEIDAYTLSTWRRLVSEAATTATDLLIVDTRGLQFLSYQSLVVLAEEAQRGRHRGLRLHVVSGRPVVARLLAAAELTARLPVYPSVQDALDCSAAPDVVEDHLRG